MEVHLARHPYGFCICGYGGPTTRPEHAWILGAGTSPTLIWRDDCIKSFSALSRVACEEMAELRSEAMKSSLLTTISFLLLCFKWEIEVSLFSCLDLLLWKTINSQGLNNSWTEFSILTLCIWCYWLYSLQFSDNLNGLENKKVVMMNMCLG